MPSIAPFDFTVTPFAHDEGSKVTMGVAVRGLLVNELESWPGEVWDAVKNLVLEHKLVCFKDQGRLDPKQQLTLVSRYSGVERPIAMHSRDPKLFSLRSGAAVVIPAVPETQVVGCGPVPEGHGYGIDGAIVSQRTSAHLYKTPLTQEEIDAGIVRLVQLHYDSALYEVEPPQVGSLFCVQPPAGDDLTLRLDTAFGCAGEKKIQPGATCYYSMAQLYSLLTEDQKRVVDNSRVTYAPRAFTWMSTTSFTEDGASIYSEGKEMDLDELPPWKEEHVKTYPMVWINPATNEKSLMIHGQAAWKLHLKDGPEGEERLVEDLAEVRKFVYDLHRLILKPEYTYAHPYETGDLLLWHNFGLMHSATDLPKPKQSRVMHQINVAHQFGPEHPTLPDSKTPAF